MDLPRIKSYPFSTARPRIADIIDDNVTRDDFGRPEPYYGYSAIAFTSNPIKSRKVDLRIKAGGQSKGDTWLQTGDWQVLPDPAIVTYALFKAALLAINAIWPPIWACAYAFRSNTLRVPESYPGGVQGYRLESLPMVPNDPTFQDSVFHIPWIAYLPAPLADGVTLPPEIATEQSSDGGLLMVATTDRLDPENPEHLRRARLILEAMLARTGYSTYANQH
jgi:Immunity protein 52